MLPTQAFRLAIQPAKEQEDFSGWSLQVICSGRLNSFQLKSVREVLRDWYHIDGIYWPNTLHLDTGEAPVCKHQDGKSWSHWLTSAFVKVDLSYQNLRHKGGDVNPNWSNQARVSLLPRHWPVYTTQLNGWTGTLRNGSAFRLASASQTSKWKPGIQAKMDVWLPCEWGLGWEGEEKAQLFLFFSWVLRRIPFRHTSCSGSYSLGL